MVMIPACAAGLVVSGPEPDADAEVDDDNDPRFPNHPDS